MQGDLPQLPVPAVPARPALLVGRAVPRRPGSRSHMDHSVTFARHFARLVAMLLDDPANVGEQKAALRALVTIAQDGAVTIAPLGDGIAANGTALSAAFPGAAAVAAGLGAHGAGELVVQASAAAADILDAARLLAGHPGASGAADRLRAGGGATVVLQPRPAVAGRPAALAEFELVPDDAVAAAMEPRKPRASGSFAVQDAPASGGLFTQFASARDSAGHPALLAELHAASDGAALGVLDRVALAAGQAQADGRAQELATLLASVIRRADRAAPEWTRDFALTQRRMITAHGLRMIAALVPRRAAPREDLELVLGRAGEDGAEAVIDLLTQAQSATDRRTYFDLLLTLRAGIPALTHMLGDARWFVVRNAVELLGEMDVKDAERAITALLEHVDARVRAAAAGALLRFDTPTARAAVHAALRSDSPETRQQVVTALAARNAPGAAGTLLRALDREEDEAVQRAIYAALGKVATPDAVERLVAAAEPPAGLFRRKSLPLRVAATLGLAEAGTAEALAALQALAKDKEREVREAAARRPGKRQPGETAPGSANRGEW